MKDYRETYIRKAEIAQLIILHQIYAQSGSQELIFQGGTALRWCYGGSWFSEDLDFVTLLPPETVKAKLQRAVLTTSLNLPRPTGKKWNRQSPVICRDFCPGRHWPCIMRMDSLLS